MIAPSGLCIMCPTRGRPEQFVKMIESFDRCTSTATLLAYVDVDQIDLYKQIRHPRLVKHFGPKVGPAVSANVLSSITNYDFYGLMTDDATFESEKFDENILRHLVAMPGRIGVASPAHNLGSHLDYPYVSRRWIDALDYYVPRGIFHRGICAPIAALGAATRIDFIPAEECFIKHDVVVAECQNRGTEVADALSIWGWLNQEMPSDVARLRAYAYD